MRLFVALVPPEAARRSIAEQIASERASLPSASWVREQNLHLTLLFLGEVDEAQAARAAHAFAAAGAAPLSALVTMPVAGGFPAHGPIRVVWLALEPAQELARLAGTLRAAAERAGLPFDAKPFHPHLTLARCRTPWPSALRPGLARLVPPSSPAFRAERLTLVSSVPGPSGPTYTQISEIALEEAA